MDPTAMRRKRKTILDMKRKKNQSVANHRKRLRDRLPLQDITNLNDRRRNLLPPRDDFGRFISEKSTSGGDICTPNFIQVGESSNSTTPSPPPCNTLSENIDYPSCVGGGVGASEIYTRPSTSRCPTKNHVLPKNSALNLNLGPIFDSVVGPSNLTVENIDLTLPVETEQTHELCQLNTDLL